MLNQQLVPMPCFMVNNLTSNSLEQCKFILDNDCLEEDAAIDYVHLVYCEFGHELRYVSIILIVFLVIVLFLALSSIADEFLCPSLLAVAKNLRMSDSLAVSSFLCCTRRPEVALPNDQNTNPIKRESRCSPSAMDVRTYSPPLRPLRTTDPS